MQHVSTAIKFRVAGSGPIEQSLRDLAAGDGRIEFLGRISDEQLADEYSRRLQCRSSRSTRISAS